MSGPTRRPVSAGSGGQASDWAASAAYKAGTLVRAPDGSLQRARVDFTAGATFDPTKWLPVVNPRALAATRETAPLLTQVGAVSAFKSSKVFVAPCPCRILDCGLLIDSAIATSGTNYWEALVRKRTHRPYETPYRDSVLADNPLRYWKLDEITGTVAADLTANAQNGTHTSGPVPGVTGAPNADMEIGVSYDGVDDYTTFGSATLAWGNVLTIEAWVKPNALNIAQTILGNENATSSPRLAIDANGRVIVAIGATIVFQETSNLLRAGVWNHIGYRRSTTGTGGHSLLVNGVNPTSTTAAGDYTNQAATWTLGRRAAASELFAGAIDEVALYASVVPNVNLRARYGVLVRKSTINTLAGEPIMEGRPWAFAGSELQDNTLRAGEQLLLELQPIGAPAALNNVVSYVRWEPV